MTEQIVMIPTFRVAGTDITFEVGFDMFGTMPEEVSYLECPHCEEVGDWILHPERMAGDLECQVCFELVECPITSSRWSDEGETK